MERISWDGLKASEREELEAALRDSERFLSDYGDTSAWWLLFGLAGVGGTIAAGMELWDGGFADLGWGLSLQGLAIPAGFVASLAAAVWCATAALRNRGRRGFAVTSFATIRVKGPRLVLVRHREVVRIEWTQVAPPRRQRFSVLRLTGTDGRSVTLYVYAGWVRTAIAQIDRARAEAQLPPIQGDARIVPE